MIKHRSSIIASIIILATLALAFYIGNDGEKADSSLQGETSGAASSGAAYDTGTASGIGDSQGGNTDPGKNGVNAHQNANGNDISQTDGSQTGGSQTGGSQTGGSQTDGSQTGGSQTGGSQTGGSQTGESQTDTPQTDGAQPSQPQPSQPQPNEPAASSPPGEAGQDNPQQGDGEDRDMTVTLIISVETLLDKLDSLAAGKAELVPPDGIIYSGVVAMNDGESAFQILRRETRGNKIHMESSSAPLSDSAYIEGIGNIYEFDAGERSGWLYSVNGIFPNISSSRYTIVPGDVILFVYTCSRGEDVGAIQ